MTEGGCTGHGSDMLMSTEGSRIPLFDISKSPLIDFHCQERHHQGNSAKVYLCEIVSPLSMTSTLVDDLPFSGIIVKSIFSAVAVYVKSIFKKEFKYKYCSLNKLPLTQKKNTDAPTNICRQTCIAGSSVEMVGEFFWLSLFYSLFLFCIVVLYCSGIRKPSRFHSYIQSHWE